MIPTSIQKKHVLMAAEWIDQHGVPGGRESKKYVVIIDGKPYPPKLVISRAYVYVHGSEWSHENFTGGEETNSYLKGLGFKVVDKGSLPAVQVKERGVGPICEKCGHVNPPDFVFCEMCGHQGRFTAPSGLLGARGGGDRTLSLRESRGEARFKAALAGAASFPPGSNLNRVRLIAKRLGVGALSVEADADKYRLSSFLIWPVSEHEIWIAENRSGLDNVLLLNSNVRFNNETSAHIGSIPQKDHAEILSKLMYGRTEFKITLEGEVLSEISLHQSISACADDAVLQERLVNAIEEIVATCARVRNVYAEMIDFISKAKEKKSPTTPPNHMYA